MNNLSTFFNIFNSKFTQLVGFRYVENWDLIESGDNVHTNHQYMQDSLLGWVTLIEVTRIFLAPNKIAWYLV